MKKLLYSSMAVAVVAAVFTSAPGKAEAIQSKVPRTETYVATEITATSATLNGWVRGINSGPGHAWFEYGTNPYSGNYQTSWPYKAGVRGITSLTAEKIWVKVSNLKPNTTYYYRVKAENRWGNNPANIMSFKTLPINTPAPTPKPSPTPYYYYYPPIYFSPVINNNNYNTNTNNNNPTSNSSSHSTSNNTNTNTSTNQNQNQNLNTQNQNHTTNSTQYPVYYWPAPSGNWYEY